jgi:hypothetical protein
MPSIASEPADWRCETLARASGFAAVLCGKAPPFRAGLQLSFWSFFKKGCGRPIFLLVFL